MSERPLAYVAETYSFLLKDGAKTVFSSRLWQSNTFLALFLLWLLALFGDAITTHTYLTRFGGQELNPLASASFELLGLPLALTLLTGACLFFFFLSFATPKNNEWIALFPAYFVLFAKLFAVASNLFLWSLEW